jgi:MGT family glycosyltransferase
MRVLLSSTKGLGHLLPLLHYAKALVASGHEVLVAASQRLKEPLLGAGLPHAVVADASEDALASAWARASATAPEQRAGIIVGEIFARARAPAAFPGLRELIRAWHPQLVIRESFEFAALVAAEVAGVPHVRIAVTHPVQEERLCSLPVGDIDMLRRMAGLPADDGASLRAEPVLTSFPASFERSVQIVGARRPYRINPNKEGASLARSDWRHDGDDLPLVYMTFGTDTKVFGPRYRAAISAVAALPVRALLTTGRRFDLDALGTVPANLRIEAWVPQAEVFPRAAALVCHGGAGTVLGGLAAGLPQVVIPQGADQPENAQSVAAIGAGIALGHADAEALRGALQQVLNAPEFRRAARAVAREMAALPSADDAVKALIEFATHRAPLVS